MRFFCTAGPVRNEDHYCLPPLGRLELNEVLALIDQQQYFVLHAPRQTGKTTCLLALAERLNRAGKYHALYCNVELAQAAREDVQRGMQAIFGEMASRARDFLDDTFLFEQQRTLFEQFGADGVLNAAVTEWSKASAKPIILLIDEIDALIGDMLISVLRQLRAGYDKRPRHFPQSIILCGVRDVRDYRIHSTQEKAVITGGSAFNIKAESLRLGNFQQREIATLLHQHTDATGQVFADDALEQVWDLTRGQPWLVNALCYEACFKAAAGRDHTQPITATMIETAKEQIVLRRETHIDQLVDKLTERRVQNVIEPILAGIESTALIPTDDILYVRDLGLIQTDEGQLKIANRIYQEVIPRELTFSTQLTNHLGNVKPAMTNATEHIGMTRDAIDTPVLLVDLDALEYNIDLLAEHFRTAGKNLRPHTKSHKTPAIAHLQLTAGAQGITCAKVGEAEVMAAAGIQDILIANEVVGRRKIERLMALASRCDIMVAVDDPQNLADLNEAAHAYKVSPRVLVEVNIGHNRCGVAPATVVDLARAVSQAPHLRFCGLMGYEGHIIDLEDKDARDDGARTCLQRLVNARDDVERAGLDCPICSASGTGDYYISTSFDGITEVQAGSYALMDAAYAKLDLGFKNALSVLTTVTSRPSPEQVITDAGLKSLTPEHGFPLVKDRPDLECHALSEEHGRLKTIAGPCTDLHPGDLLEFIPGHGCTTVNLHDHLYALRTNRLEAIWEIAGRGKVR